MANNEVETLLNEEENQVFLTKEEPVVQQQEESADFLDENANMYSDSYRKSVFDGGTPIYPYGKDNEAIYLNDPNIDELFYEDLFQKHLEVNAPKKEIDPFEGMTLDEIQAEFATKEEKEQRGEIAIFGEPTYVTQYNNKQVQTLRKHKIPEPIQKILVEGNFALPFERNTGYVEDANKTIGLLSMLDGLWDNYIAFTPNVLKNTAAKLSQKKLNEIQLAIEGRWDEMPTLSMIGDLKGKTLEELDILRGQEQAKMEMFLEGKITTSTQWWQNRIRKELGVEVPLEVLEDLKKDAGGFMSKTTGFVADYAIIAGGFSTAIYKNALKKYKDYSGWLAKFKKTKSYSKDMTEKDLYNAFMKDKFPTGDTATTVKGGWWNKFWTGSQLKTGMDIRTSKEFQKKAKQLSDEIGESNKIYQQGSIDYDLGKIDKQQLIRLHDNVRDLQFKHLSYTIQGIPKIFKQDAAMELGFAAGAVTVSEVFGDQYEFVGGISGGLGLGLGGNWAVGVGRTTYHAIGSLLDGLTSVPMREAGIDVMRLKPEALRNIKIYDKEINGYRELKWYEFAMYEKFAQQINQGGPDVIKHIQANFNNYNRLVADVEKVIGSENIHLFHEQFAIVSMLGPMMAARDAAQTQHSTIRTIFSKENPEFLDSMKRHHYMLQSLKNIIDEMSQKTVRGVVGDEKGVIRGQFDAMQTALNDFVEKSQMELTNEFSRLMDTSTQFYANIGNLDHPMWMDTEVLYQNLDNMDEFFNYMKNDPILSTLISKPQYESLVNDVTRYADGAKSINEQVTRAIYNTDLSTVPKNLESMQNRLAKSLVMMEKHHFEMVMQPYNKLYSKYKNAEIDGFNLFEDFWKQFGKEDNWLKGKRIFWRGNEKAPREFRKIKGIFDEAAERIIQKLHIIEKGDAYIDGLTSSLRKLEYEKWFKQKQIALAEQLEVKPNVIDHMTLFEYLRKSVTDEGKTLQLTFNLKELNKLRSEFQRIDFVLTKKGDTSAGAFGSLFDSTDNLLDDLTVKYKEAHPNMKNELSMARENYKYNYANRYLDKESATGQIGGHWITYSQLGKEFTVGPYTPGGRTFKDHPTQWINFNAVKKNPELFRDQISMAMGKYVPGKGYVINPTSAESLMWQAFVTRMIDESLSNEFRKNIGKFTNGTYRILGDEIVDTQGHSINLFHDIYKLADSLTFDTVDGGKWAIYNVDNLVNNEKAVIKELSKNKNLAKELEKLKSEIIKKSTVDGAIIRKANQLAERKILDNASRINKGLNDTKSFVEHFIGQARDTKHGGELILLKETLIKQGVFKNEAEVNKVIAGMVGDYISMTFGPKRQAGKILYGAREENLLNFKFGEFGEWLQDVEPTLRQILDEEHMGYLRSSADLFSIVSREMMKIGDNAAAVMYPGGLGIPAILSRVYGLARGVIGIRFVASEMMIRFTQKGKGNFIKEMVQNKDAARVINELIERGTVNSKIDRDFKRVVMAAYIETAILEPESEKLDVPSFFGLGIPWVDTERILKTPAEFVEGFEPDMSKQEQYTTMYPEGSEETGGFPAEEHMKAYERPTEKEQMERLGFPF